MKKFDPTTTIAICALISVLFGLIQFSIWPIKKDILRLESVIKENQAVIKENQLELKEIKALIRDFKQASGS